MSYFVLKCLSPRHADHYSLRVSSAVRSLRWVAGVRFTESEERRGMHPPQVPIAIDTVPEAPEPPHIYPVLAWNPIPLMSRRLVDVLQGAGVTNLQKFETHLASVQGNTPPPSDYYLAVNIIGLVSAVDLKRTKTNPEVSDTHISMDIHSLSIDETKTGDRLLFRLEENITAVLVHESVKRAVEDAGIDTLTWLAPEQWAE